MNPTTQAMINADEAKFNGQPISNRTDKLIAAMVAAQEAKLNGQPAPQPRVLTTILMMLNAQEARYTRPTRKPHQFSTADGGR